MMTNHDVRASLTAFLETWKETFPDAEVVTIDDASHYLQEDSHEVIVPQLIEFLGR